MLFRSHTMRSSMVCKPFTVEAELTCSSIDDLVEFFVQHAESEFEISALVGRSDMPSEAVLLGVYPSGAIRGIPGSIKRTATGVILHLTEISCMIDPDWTIDGMPAGPFKFDVAVAAFEVLKD